MKLRSGWLSVIKSEPQQKDRFCTPSSSSKSGFRPQVLMSPRSPETLNMVFPHKLLVDSKIIMEAVWPVVDRLSWPPDVLQQRLLQPLQASQPVSPPGNTLLRESDDQIKSLIVHSPENQIIIIILIVYSPQSGELLCSSPRRTGCHERVAQSHTKIMSMGFWQHNDER